MRSIALSTQKRAKANLTIEVMYMINGLVKSTAGNWPKTAKTCAQTAGLLMARFNGA
jgi:hypothetical protein